MQQARFVRDQVRQGIVAAKMAVLGRLARYYVRICPLGLGLRLLYG